MCGFAGGEEFAGFLPKDFICEANAAPAGFAHARADTQHIVIARRPQIAAMRFGYRDEGIALGFHLFVDDAFFAHVFDASNFEIREIVAVVDHAHLIGFLITNPCERFGKFVHDLRPSCQRGWRFSRNAESPSRKSGVERMATLSATASSMRRSISASAVRTSRRLVA